MHSAILDMIVSNAFNGLGDSTGSDDFGYSVAWIDVADHLEPYTLTHPVYGMAETDSDTLTAIARNYLGGERYALAYLNADGSREVVAYPHLDSVKFAFDQIDAAFTEWHNEATYTRDAYDEFLDAAYPTYSIEGTTLRPSQILKQVDEPAYNEGFSNWFDFETRL